MLQGGSLPKLHAQFAGVHKLSLFPLDNYILNFMPGLLEYIRGEVAQMTAFEIISIFIGILALLIAFVIQFFCFHLDYSRTERLQFEDDEYYYYVKAIPKVMVSGSEKKVKKFSGRDEEERLTKKRFAEEMDIDEELLD